MSVNKVILVGFAGADPEVRYTGDATNGSKVAQLRLATSEKYRDRDGNVKEHTEWHNVVLWRSLADVVEKYVKKGTQLYIEGKLQTRSWEDNAGVKRFVTDVVASTCQLLGRKENSDNRPPHPAVTSDPYVQGARQMSQQQANSTSGPAPHAQAQQQPQQPQQPVVGPEDMPDDDLPF